MRIISQNGFMDFLYDSLILEIEGNCITARIGDISVIVAQYSSCLVAMKALDKLHERYSRMDISVWQFPTEEEL